MHLQAGARFNMSHNPKIKNTSNGSLSVSGSLVLTLSEASITANTVKTTFISSSNVKVSKFNSSVVEKNKLLVTGSGLRTALYKINSDLQLDGDGHIVLADATSGEVVVDLVSASLIPEQEYIIKKIDSSNNPVIIKTANKELFGETVVTGRYAVDAADYFGYSVAVNSFGDKFVVGAYADETSTLVGGLAYVYSTEYGIIKNVDILGESASNGVSAFGVSVAINSAGNSIAVGASYSNIALYPSGIRPGAVYVYTSQSNGWTRTSILSGTLATDSDYFGNYVAMNAIGDRIIVGAFEDDKIQNVTPVTGSGLAYIYLSSSSGWKQTDILSGSLSGDNDNFGNCVAMNSAGNRVAIGAYNDETSGVVSTGLVYIFDSGSRGWNQHQMLSGSKATQTNDWFGYSVAINSAGDRVVVGAYNDESGSISGTGLAYIFTSGSSGWKEAAILSGSQTSLANDNFGYSVAINSAGDQVVIGSRGENRAYVFASGTSGWFEQNILSSSNYVGGKYGFSVATNTSTDAILVGAPYYSANSASLYNGICFYYGKGELQNTHKQMKLINQYDTVTLISDGTSSWDIII